MNTTPLKNYAPQARKDFIAAVTTAIAAVSADGGEDEHRPDREASHLLPIPGCESA